MMDQPTYYVKSLKTHKVINVATSTGEEIIRLYYKTVEHRPHRAYQLYLDTAVMIWDGNPVVGEGQIKKFFEELPSLTFKIASMDAQPLSDIAIGSQTAFVINTYGGYRAADGQGNQTFCQNFVVAADSNAKWKIASDTLRSQISPNQTWIS